MSSSCLHCSSKRIKKLETRNQKLESRNQNQETRIKKLETKIQLGYARFYCSSCRKRFNERTNTPFNLLQVPTDVMLMAIRWRLLYKLSLRDLSDMFLERGFQFSHEIIRQWENKFTPLIIDKLRKKRRGRLDSSWYVDETQREEKEDRRNKFTQSLENYSTDSNS